MLVLHPIGTTTIIITIITIIPINVDEDRLIGLSL
jgi:hypothetical protein